MTTPTVRDLMERTLVKDGYHVVTAADGRAAWTWRGNCSPPSSRSM